MSSRRTFAEAWDSGRNHFHPIRLLAAWTVIYSHAWAITGAPGTDHIGHLTAGLMPAGGLAVDVFFAISGFLVAASFERNPVSSFIAARVLRIYPALIVNVLLAVFVLGPLLTTAGDYWANPTTWRYLWVNSSLWSAEFWLPGVFDDLPRTVVNGSLWTLPIELKLYAALLLAGVLGMLAPRRYVPAWALAIAAAWTWAYMRGPLPEHLQNLLWLVSFFITGTLFWTLRTRIRLDGRLLLALLALAAVTRGTPAFKAAYFAVVVYGTFWLAFLPGRPLIERNDLSYGVYLYGWPMQQLALLAGATTIVGNILVASLLALVCAALSWFLVEKPALSYKRKIVRMPVAGSATTLSVMPSASHESHTPESHTQDPSRADGPQS